MRHHSLALYCWASFFAVLSVLTTVTSAEDVSEWDVVVTDHPKGESISPFYYNDEDLTSIQAVGLAAAFLSACAGHPNTVSLVVRPITALSMCKPPKMDPQYILQVPVVVAAGDDPITQYYAGNAIYNLPLLVGLALVACAAAMIVSLSTEYTFWQALRKGRFPGSLIGPYFYLSYQSTAGSVTLFTTPSRDSTMLIVAIASLSVWLALVAPVCILILFKVPRFATLVENFAEVSRSRGHKRKRLMDYVRDYIAQLDTADAAAAATRKSEDAVEREEDDGATSEAPTGTIHTIISNVVTRLKLWGTRSTTGTEDREMMSPEQQEKFRIRQNAMFSKLLADQLESLDRKHLELTDLLAGPHRWEDTIPDETDVPLGVSSGSNDDAMSEVSHNSMQFLGKASGFVKSTGIVFEPYKLPWFIFVEIAMCFICGFSHGWRPDSDAAIDCVLPAAILTVANAVYSVLLFVLDVHVSWFEDGVVKAIALMQTLASCVALISLTAPGDTMELVSYLLALLSLYFVILKGLLHTYEILSWWMAVPGTQWAAVEEYSGHYKKMDRQNSVAKPVVKKVLVARRMRSDEVGSNHSSITSNDGGEKQSEFVLAEKEVFINEEDESHFASVGGRANAYVSSRGVPLSLLPFNLAPLPKYAPLPARTRTMEEGLRAHKKQTMLDARKKKLWEQVKHLFTEEGGGEPPENGYEGKDIAELQRLADLSRRMQENGEGGGRASKAAEAGSVKGMSADDLLGEVRDRIEQEYRRNEEIDELRRNFLKGKIGPDHWKLQEALEKGDFYNDGEVTMKGALFNSGDVFSPPPASLINNRSMCFSRGSSPDAKHRHPFSLSFNRRPADAPVPIDRNASMRFNALNNTSLFDYAVYAEMRKGGADSIANSSMANPSLFLDSAARGGNSFRGSSTTTTTTSNNDSMAGRRSAIGGGANRGNSRAHDDPLHLSNSLLLVDERGPASATESASANTATPIMMKADDHKALVASEVLVRLGEIKAASRAQRQQQLEKSRGVTAGPSPPPSQQPVTAPSAVPFFGGILQSVLGGGGGNKSAKNDQRSSMAASPTLLQDSLTVSGQVPPTLLATQFEYDML